MSNNLIILVYCIFLTLWNPVNLLLNFISHKPI